MERRVKTADNAELLEHYRDLLQTAEELPLTISGNSMVPFLVHGRDRVYLTRPKGELKTGDIVLYLRDNGTYVLHRICRLEDGCYALIGDGQAVVEHGIRRDQIFALAHRAVRKGKPQAPGFFW